MKASSRLSLALALFALAPVALAQESADPEVQTVAAAPRGDILSLSTNGLDAALTSPKDGELLAALKLLVGRLTELPVELGEADQLPPAATPLIERLCYGQMKLRVGASEPGSESGLPFYARLECDRQEGFAPMAELLTNLLDQVGMQPSEADLEGWTALPLPIPARYRDTDGNFALEVGDVSPALPRTNPLTLGEGVRPSMAMRLDYGAMMNMFMSMQGGGADTEEFEKLLTVSGMRGVEIEYVTGTDDERSYARSAMRGWLKQETSEIMSTAPIPTSAFNRIPVDAEWASVTSVDFSGVAAYYGSMFHELADPDGEYPNLFEQVLGMHDFELERDLTRYMGTSQGYYASPAGGGGLYSMVSFFSLTNPTAFAASLGRLEERFTDAVAEDSRGYVRLNVTEEEGTRLTTLEFPGLPIPFSLTHAIADDHWVFGFSRAAVLASIAQARSGGPGLLEAPGFLEQLGGDPAGASSIYYFNTPALLDDGYTVADLAATMLANSLRSRTGTEGATREVGQLLPSLAELREGALPIVSISWIEGEDLISEYRGDRSSLVNGTALVPYFAGVYAVFFGSVALAGISEETSGAYVQKQRVAQQEIRQIRAAMELFAVEHDGRYPKSMRALVRKTEEGKQYLVRKELPMDPWHRFYHYDPPTDFQPEPRVYSLGADGERGGAQADLDIGKDTVLGQESNPLEQLLYRLFN